MRDTVLFTHFIGFSNLSELLGCLWVALVAIWMVLLSKLVSGEREKEPDSITLSHSITDSNEITG